MLLHIAGRQLLVIMEYSLSKNPVSDLYKKADSYCLNTEGAEKVSGKEKFTQARRKAALHKYEEAVALYATTDMPVRLIAKECHVPEGGQKTNNK